MQTRTSQSVSAKRLFVAFMVCAISIGCASQSQALDDSYLVYVADDGVILEGYDVVSLSTEGRQVTGSQRHKTSYHGAYYLFASRDNQKLFEANPDKYRPQFGGHCSMAMAMGKLEPGDPNTWSILDGRLVVQRNAKAKMMWERNPQGNLNKADGNWPTILSREGKRG